MPDWSYHTIFKPFLFRMPADVAKKITLGAVAALGTMPGGRALIDLMGNMTPDPQMSVKRAGLRFASRVGLGCGISETVSDLRAFEHFGFGFIELGPLTVAAVTNDAVAIPNDGGHSQSHRGDSLQRQNAQLSLTGRNLPINEGLNSFLKKQLPASPTSLPLLIRIAHVPNTPCKTALEEVARINSALPEWIGAIVVDTRWCLTELSEDELSQYLEGATSNSRKVLMAIAPDESHTTVTRLISCATRCGIKGVTVTGGIKSGEELRSSDDLRLYGRPTLEASLAMVRHIRSLNKDLLVIGSGGVVEPCDAIKMQEAGADLVSLYSGFVFSGPGLPKRINELIMTYASSPSTADATRNTQVSSPYSFSSVLNSGWLGLALVGFGLILTGASAITVALTTVILPYDESFLGLTREALVRINPRLLPFLSHDRVTYAGAGMSCGLLFFSLTYFAGRCGQKWAYTAAVVSCAAGFASFLLFLAYKFLDPLHALVTLILVPFYIWALMKPPKWRPMSASNMYNSRAWRNSLSGQLLFVGIGTGLVLAGAAICRVGSTTVFVEQDLMFMQTTAHHLLSHNEHLLPEIAHDRAGFGGTLVTAGIAVLLTSLQGFRQGEGWVWWMLLIAGLPGYLSTLGIHFFIGYTDFVHLFPAYLATLMFIMGLALSYKYLCVEPSPDALLAERSVQK